MPDGAVKFLNRSKGYGFISQGGGEPDLFFHRSAVPAELWDGLHEGQQVEFEGEETDRGPEATRVTARAADEEDEHGQ